MKRNSNIEREKLFDRKEEGNNKIPPNPAELKANANKAKDWINDAPQVDYEVHQVPVNSETGAVGTPNVSPWIPKPPKTK